MRPDDFDSCLWLYLGGCPFIPRFYTSLGVTWTIKWLKEFPNWQIHLRHSKTNATIKIILRHRRAFLKIWEFFRWPTNFCTDQSKSRYCPPLLYGAIFSSQTKRWASAVKNFPKTLSLVLPFIIFIARWGTMPALFFKTLYPFAHLY